MADLTLIQKYDEVLTVLYDESGNSPSFDDITGKLGAKGLNIHWGEIMDVLFTLDKEGLIYKVTLQEDKTNEIRYLLNFAGKRLKEDGGLAKKLVSDRKRWHEKNPITYAVICGVLAGLMSITVSIVTHTIEKSQDNQEKTQLEHLVQDVNNRLDSLTLILNKIPDSLKR